MKQVKIVFQGDSITDAGRDKRNYHDMGKGYPHFAARGIRETLPDAEIEMINLGISGNRTDQLFDRLYPDAIELAPDVISILIGINDVWRQFDSPEIKESHVSPEDFRATYERLIASTLPRVKGMVLMTPYFMEPNKLDPMRARMDEYGDIVKELAEKYNLICVDLQAGWDKLFEHMHPCNIAWDRIHPNQVGCMYIAKQFLKAIGADRC